MVEGICVDDTKRESTNSDQAIFDAGSCQEGYSRQQCLGDACENDDCIDIDECEGQNGLLCEQGKIEVPSVIADICS